MAKKSFKGTVEHIKSAPALSFISEIETSKVDDGREIKSKRLNLLIKPTIYKNIEKVATMERISTNELINRVLERYTIEQADVIAKHDEIFKEEI